MKEIVNEIRNQFIKEAENSPLLMADLAKMEQYISESYSGRSLIELLQNADDAQSNRFLIKIIDSKHALIANDGRIFTQEDLISLCRSGASTKKRKSNTIGFRGIGFKSVVNYATRVMIFSGKLGVEFSKNKTKKMLPGLADVPLIRIPHEISEILFKDEIRSVYEEGYKTVFLFETSNITLKNEILDFDKSSMLFLKSVRNIEFRYDGFNEVYIAKKEDNDAYSVIEIENKDVSDKSEWLYFSSGNIAFAFKSDGGYAVEESNKERVIHSFMPTRDIFCIPCKINGDFSTDPSRTKVVCDDETKAVLNSAAEYLAKLVNETIVNGCDNLNLINVISKMNVNPIKISGGENFNDLFTDAFNKSFKKISNGKNYIIQPEWIDEHSFLKLGLNGVLITKSLTYSIPGIDSLLKKVGFSEIAIDEVVYNLPHDVIDRNVRLCILAELVKYTRFTMENKLKKKILSMKLFEVDGEPKITSDLKEKKIDIDFYKELVDMLTDEQDFYWFAKKLNIPNCIPEDENEIIYPDLNEDMNYIFDNDNVDAEYSNDDIIENEDKISYVDFNELDKDDSLLLKNVSRSKEKNENKKFERKGKIKKWRSIEQNVIEFFKDEANVQSVKDVSTMNIGYDIEVLYNDGTTLCVEVKSVKQLGDAFTMTNNEYSLANFNPDNYALAVATSNDEELQICLIRNPANTLELERRIVRWEWVCNSYEGKHIVLPIEE